jgi:molybdate transport system substrate-binding protein
VAYTNPASGGASGAYFSRMLEQLGITDVVSKKAKLGDGGPIAQIVARGEAEFGIQQIPELLAYPGVDYVGPLPGPLQLFTRLAAGIPANGAQTDAARALLEFLGSPPAVSVMQAKGLEPG